MSIIPRLQQCNTPQHTHSATHCTILQHTTAATSRVSYRSCCSELKCVPVCCSVLQCFAVCCSVLQCVVVCCSVLQCVAVCCSVLQCVAVCCSVSHRYFYITSFIPIFLPARISYIDLWGKKKEWVIQGLGERLSTFTLQVLVLGLFYRDIGLFCRSIGLF